MCPYALSRPSQLLISARHPQVLGKAEGAEREWHGHVTAITVAPEFRRLSVARRLMDLLERISDEVYRGYFVDLYVRCTNRVAIDMYEGMGYTVYRRVREYYTALGTKQRNRDEEDAFGECHGFCAVFQCGRK